MLKLVLLVCGMMDNQYTCHTQGTVKLKLFKSDSYLAKDVDVLLIKSYQNSEIVNACEIPIAYNFDIKVLGKCKDIKWK